MKLTLSIFKFFASLKLAIFSLLGLALVFSIGTFIESAYGTEAAALLVYRSPWMSMLLILLALNVAAAALDRLPWKKKHVGFVITHAGIILILAGSLVTRSYGVEGQMAIQEGQTENRMVLSETVLQISSPDSGPIHSLPIPSQAFPWRGRRQLLSSPSISILSYYPKSSRQEEIHKSSNGSAALQVVLESSWMKVDHWLVVDDAGRERITLGPADLVFSRQSLTHSSEPLPGDFLEFHFENTTAQISIPQKWPQKIPLEGTTYQVTLLRVLKNAVVDRGQLLDQSNEWKNPACELILEGEDFKEKHTVFSKFPDFPTMHGVKPSRAGVRIFYRRAADEKMVQKNELRFIWQKEGLPLYQVRGRGEISEGTVQLGEDYETGWMDFKFRVEQYYPHVQVNTVFREEPVSSQAEGHLSAVEIELERAGETKSVWLGQGERKMATVGGQSFQIVYGLKTQPIGFRITLRDFRVENYPGTNRPASFESDVTLKDDSAGTVRDVNIRMNQPLQYRGYRVFQSGYQQPEGESEVSIFTVAKDPGVPLKYTGALIMISGILIMFYTRRFSNLEMGDGSGGDTFKSTILPRPVPFRTVPLLLLLPLLFTGFLFKRDESAESILGRIPVQSGGRVKPFDSFSREALLSVTGKTSLEGQRAATVVWQWISNPEGWYTESFLPVRFESLKKELNLMVIAGKISPELVLTHLPFKEKVEQALQREQKKESLTPLEKKRIELYDQARLFQAIAQGSLPGFIPDPEDPRAGWFPLESLAQPEGRRMLETVYPPVQLASVEKALRLLVQSFQEEEKTNVSQYARQFAFSLDELRELRGITLDQGKISAELFYHQVRPFRWAWMMYLMGAMIWFLLRERLAWVPLGFFTTGFLTHTLGFVLRCQIAGRPPVSNMYESIIWVAWAAVLFSFLLGLIYRKRVIVISAALVSSFALLIGESFPSVLDPSLSPLVPVLRNNYWLTIHVLTITLSYGAFALAWGLAHTQLFSFAFHPERNEEQERLAKFLYRALQIGVVLLAAGTILGGVWANASWGRFWGWDPKETWALIALLGYLAVLHSRFAGWLGNFGTALGSALAFLGILMAWYGVNFVLAAGFHSYGFGGGGLPYVLAGVLADLIFISFLTFRYNKLRSAKSLYGE